MESLKLLSVLGSAGFIAVFSGCSASDPNTDPFAGNDTTQDGLTVIEMDEAAGKLVLNYQKSGRSIRYEMRLGPQMEAPPNAEDLVQNPELPTHEVDSRVLDAEGRPFLLQMGGHTFVDPTWQMPAVENFNETERLNDFALLRNAVPAFRSLTIPASLEHLRRTGIQLGTGIEDVPVKPGIENEPKLGPGVSPQGVVAWGPSSVAKWDFVVRKKCFPACGVGDHSAVYLRGWSASSSVVFRAYSCNHGTCASDTSVMRDHCVMPGFRTDDGTHSRYFYSDGCTTRYNVTSVWGHNCNDDSELQGRAIWHDRSQSTTGGSCNSAGPHNWAPGCTY
jgi:hypothetical protein